MAGMARTGKVYDDNLPVELFIKAYKNTIELLKRNVKVIDKKLSEPPKGN
jgi:hypothetical protein